MRLGRGALIAGTAALGLLAAGGFHNPQQGTLLQFGR